MMHTTDQIKEKAIPLLQKANIKKASLFGSYARGDFDENSDVDILIEPPDNMGLEFIELKLDLEDVLQKKVDLVSFRGINKYLKNHILAHQIPLV